MDLSFLNAGEKPSGRRGFLGVRDGKLVFEDGTVAKFWGTNVNAYALFGTSREGVLRQARRLSELGFNLVRINSFDSPWVTPNIFGDKAAQDTRQLSAAMLEKIDWWIKCLKDEGIYVLLGLHEERQLTAGDGILAFDEIRRGKPTADMQGYSYVNPSIREAMKRFNEAYVGHRNSYTGLRYSEDPAIIAMLITNENDVTHHFGNAFLPDRNVPQHTALFMREMRSFARAYGLPENRTWRTWEQGPAKLFLNDLEHRFQADMIDHLRTLGVRVPLATTSQWGNNPLSSLPALATGDLVDAHAYGGPGELEKNPVNAPNLVHWLAAAQVAGKPLSVTEWNVQPFPVPDRHVIPLYVAAAARLQGWDAPMQYAYGQRPLDGPGVPSNWHAFNDPALIATLPAAALLFRRGDVGEAKTTYAFAPSSEQLFGQLLSAQTAAGLRTAAEIGKVLVVLPQARELPWLWRSPVPAGARIVVEPLQSLIPEDAVEAVSDTGELRRNWQKGTYTIDTALTQAATGWIGGRTYALADVEIASTTRHATVAVQSLDGKPIRDAGAILISLGARSIPHAADRLPFYSEPVEGRLRIRATAGKRLHARLGQPQQRQELQAPHVGGWYAIDLGGARGTYWLVLK